MLDAKTTCADKLTPLYEAVRLGYVDIARMLLGMSGLKNARPNPYDIDGPTSADPLSTPLYMACKLGHVKMVRMLLTVGKGVRHLDALERPVANVHAGVDLYDDGSSFNMIHICASTGTEKYQEVAQVLAAYGVNPREVVDHFSIFPIELGAHNLLRKDATTASFRHWIEVMGGMSAYQIAASCRMRWDIHVQLRAGMLDPDALTFAQQKAVTRAAESELKDIPGAFDGLLRLDTETLTVEPDPTVALPWKWNAKVCKATTKLVKASFQGWHRKRHWLFHSGVRLGVWTTLLLAERLRRRHQDVGQDDTPSSGGTAHGHGGGGGGGADPPEDAADVCMQLRRVTRSSTAAQRASSPPLPQLPPELWMFIKSYFLRSDWKPSWADQQVLDHDIMTAGFGNTARMLGWHDSLYPPPA